MLSDDQKSFAAKFFTSTNVVGNELNGEKIKLDNDLPILGAVPSYIHCSVLEVLGNGDHPLFLCMVENVKLRNSSTPLELRKTGWKYGG